MLLAMTCIFAGIPLGWLLRHNALAVRYTNGLASVVIYGLLFFLGVSVGGNRALVARLGDLGAQGLCIGLVCGLGSAVGTLLLQRYLGFGGARQ